MNAWKDSSVLSKVRSPKTLNDYCYVALTSLIMKAFGHIVKFEILHLLYD